MFNFKEEMILYNFDILQFFDELFEVVIYVAVKFTIEYKVLEIVDEVDGVCDSVNEVCVFKIKQIILICRLYQFNLCVLCIYVYDDFLLDLILYCNFLIFYM